MFNMEGSVGMYVSDDKGLFSDSVGLLGVTDGSVDGLKLSLKFYSVAPSVDPYTHISLRLVI